ncbi:hypothetical protein K493DRAFT_91526 [Basidiobolus meristosporus CBS 931.73]|uniref:White collar 1 protein n=1 Tax=Basidiobolus meristosporus CBS 931.73 TaxID=1314790 RepID=A0A1Y1X9W3_9FUNG|nr:hypothetical protein K493DRAFT_91526 [Basidiobolus meristosporus CBS 931.73]|eukprot:ORX82533.1 hypothetical protein K493DRAFT_91526 [Basidiobolus meristosporus CBS 931.73]
MFTGPVQAVNYTQETSPVMGLHHDDGGGMNLLNLDVVDPIGYTDRDQLSDTLCQGESLGFSGMYSTTGFDMITILSKIANRPNPQINIGPVDMSCAFVVSDARQYDFPVVYATQSFERLTGYQYHETIGRNCRFLQAPDGQVTLGSRRRHTDNSTVYSIKNSILQGKEIQVSMVNYKKGGQPFVNLLTIIPISMHGDEVTHFVGFQVDLVEQPHEILGKIRDGTYLENFASASNSISTLLSSGILHSAPVELGQINTRPVTNKLPISSEVYKILGISETVDQEVAMRMWNSMLLEESDDFVHVLSLKGIFLYCSPSCEDLLEYRPGELVGTPLSDICEPSDLVPVLRELKEASEDTISMIYRIKRKRSGYMWFEAQGRLHLDKSKSRKYAILTGRPRPVYNLSREIIETCGGFNDKEFWCKLYLDGMILFVTKACEDVLGHPPSELEGTSLYQLVRSDRTTALTRAFQQAEQGITVKLAHNIQNKKGQYINVITTFYPGSTSIGGKPTFILSQTREYDCSDENSDSSNDSSAPSPQTNKVSTSEDNVFSLLNLEHKTNWQYELHQLKIANRALREELDTLATSNKRRRKRSAPMNNCCTMCQRKDSPEWRRGPLGPRTLCNSCGLKYAKTLHATKVE